VSYEEKHSILPPDFRKILGSFASTSITWLPFPLHF